MLRWPQRFAGSPGRGFPAPVSDTSSPAQIVWLEARARVHTGLQLRVWRSICLQQELACLGLEQCSPAWMPVVFTCLFADIPRGLPCAGAVATGILLWSLSPAPTGCNQAAAGPTPTRSLNPTAVIMHVR